MSDDRGPSPAPGIAMGVMTDLLARLHNRDVEPPSRLEALGALRAADPVMRFRALRPIALDPKEDERVRAAAILVLAHDGRFTEELNIETAAPPAVVSAAAKAREIRGARRLVERAMAGEEVPSALFEGPLLSMPTALPQLEVTVAPDDQRRALAAVLAESSHPIIREPAEVPLITCGRREWAILVDPKLLDPERLRLGPARPASIALRDLIEAGAWSVPLEVITAPRSEEIAIAAIDPRGHTRYLGSATPADDGALEFTVQSTDRPGAKPLRFVGRLRTGRLEIARVEGGAGPSRRLRPSPVRR